MRINFKRYVLYLLRWQASTPILAGVAILLAGMGYIVAAITANLIGGLIFFWVDQFIFTSQSLATQWDVRENITGVDCGRVARGYRLVRSGDYDKNNDPVPEFRCEECSKKKSGALRTKGIKIE
jgi:hypothetical protein